MRQMHVWVQIGTLILAMLPGMAWANAMPLGPAFRVNDFTLTTQWRPQVASSGHGDYVMAWESLNQDIDDSGIFGTASFLTTETQVNTTAVGAQLMPALSQAGNQDWIVVWDGPSPTVPGHSAVFAQGIKANGNPGGSELVIQTSPTAVGGTDVSHGFNSFVVAWGEVNASGDVEVWARQYAANQLPFGPAFRVSPFSSLHRRLPRISHTSSGDYAIAWHRGADVTFGHPAFTCYDLTGIQICSTMTLNGNSGVPDISHGLNDDFYIVHDMDWGALGKDIRLRRYNDVYQLQDFLEINSDRAGDQTRPRIDHDEDGDFVVVWESGGRIVARCFAAPVVPIGNDFEISPSGRKPEIAFYDDDRFVVTWDEGGGGDIWAREYVLLSPTDVGDEPARGAVALSVEARPTMFRQSTTLRFTLPNTTSVSARILDVRGRVVRKLLDGATLGAGDRTAVWDGRDPSGVPVAAGVYFYEVATRHDRATGRLVRLR